MVHSFLFLFVEFARLEKCYLFLDGDINLDEQEEKARLIAQVMELQNTLDGTFEFDLLIKD